MGYYQEKKRALRRIDELITQQTPIEAIYFKIETEFGFPEKFVDKRINRLKTVIGKENVSLGTD